MASKSTKKKSNSSKKKVNTKSANKKQTQNSFMKDELIVWLTLGICILILLSNFGLAGFVGDGISDVLTKVFGWVAYVIPFVLFGIVSFMISNKGNGIALIKSICVGILMILCCTLLQLLNDCGGTGLILSVAWCIRYYRNHDSTFDTASFQIFRKMESPIFGGSILYLPDLFPGLIYNIRNCKSNSSNF